MIFLGNFYKTISSLFKNFPYPSFSISNTFARLRYHTWDRICKSPIPWPNKSGLNYVGYSRCRDRKLSKNF